MKKVQETKIKKIINKKKSLEMSFPNIVLGMDNNTIEFMGSIQITKCDNG